MAVQVKWFATLVKRTKSRQPQTEVQYRAGLTPMKIFLDEGFDEVDGESVRMLVNDAQVEPNHHVADGDRVEYMVSVQGK